MRGLVLKAEFRHALNLYESLQAKAVVKDDELVFSGSLVEMFRSLKISQGYYSDVTRGLYTLGCMQMKQRGARSSPSIIVLHNPPTVEAWAALADSDLTTRPSGATMLEKQLENLERRMGGMDIVEAFADHEARIVQLENLTREVSESGKATQ